MALTDYLYPVDLTGQAATNKVLKERQTLNPPGEPLDYHFILTKAGPYYRDTLKLKHITTGRTLTRGVDWMPGHKFHSASYETEGIRGGIYQSILFMDRTLSGIVEITEYQVLGGSWSLNETKLLEIASNRAIDPRTVTYEEVSGVPTAFPPIEHAHDVTDLTGLAEVIASNYDIAAAIRERTDHWLENPPVLFSEYYSRDEMDAILQDLSAGGGASDEDLIQMIDSMTTSYATAANQLAAIVVGADSTNGNLVQAIDSMTATYDQASDDLSTL
ncbi:hypothetical protein D3C85_244870 [compost metagenome]